MKNIYKVDKPLKKTEGFTLVELSIVIIIIGLIIASVTAGQSLVTQVRMNRVIYDSKKYISAIGAFKIQYNVLPGDIANASAYWPSCVTVGSNPCNGDGNKKVADVIGAGYEHLRLWQHLTLSGILPGSYTGTDTINSPLYRQMNININAPAAALPNVGWMVENRAWYSLPAINRLMLSGISAPSYGGPSLTPLQAMNIDKKIDDGVAATGKLIAKVGNLATANCVGGSNNYDLTVKSIQCFIEFDVGL